MSNRTDTTRLQDMARAYTTSAVLYTALDVGLFTHISNGHNTEAALTQEQDCGLLMSTVWFLAL